MDSTEDNAKPRGPKKDSKFKIQIVGGRGRRAAGSPEGFAAKSWPEFSSPPSVGPPTLPRMGSRRGWEEKMKKLRWLERRQSEVCRFADGPP